MKKRWKCILLFALILTIGMMIPNMKADAASKGKKALNAYKSYLEKHTSGQCSYFTLVDINRDGVKELLVSYDKYGQAMSVYAIRNGKVSYAGGLNNKYVMGIRYNPGAKGLVVENGGSGAQGLSLWKLSNAKLVETNAVMTSFGQKVTYSYKYKSCSKKAYNKYYKKYYASSKIKMSYFVRNNSSNRKKKF